jgi:hypothetical protein
MVRWFSQGNAPRYRNVAAAKSADKGGLRDSGSTCHAEMVLRYAHLASEKLSSVASRIEWQPSRPESSSRSQDGATDATFSLRSTD